MYILDRYCVASGQSINFSKPAVMFSPNCSEELQQQICGLLKVQLMNSKARNLRLPSMFERNKENYFLSFLKEKMLQNMQGWKQKFLTQAGREVLI